jgi:hypothetical protein
MKLARASLLAAVLAATSSMTFGQEAAHAPDANSFEVFRNISIPAKTQAPFTSVVTAEWVRVLEDGTTTSRQNRRLVVRDSAGRIFQERRWLAAMGTPGDNQLMRVEISDPVKHTKYFCRPADMVCMLRDYDGADDGAAEDPAGETNEKLMLTREELGKSNISGIDVVGTRETRVIAAGVMGNDRPVSVIKEFWYSPQLGINMQVKRIDPRVGTQTITVTEVSLGEPDPKYFQLPASYKVTDVRKARARNQAQGSGGQR